MYIVNYYIVNQYGKLHNGGGEKNPKISQNKGQEVGPGSDNCYTDPII